MICVLIILLQVLGTIYTFKPQNATVSQLFVLIIGYVLGEAMCEYRQFQKSLQSIKQVHISVAAQ